MKPLFIEIQKSILKLHNRAWITADEPSQWQIEQNESYCYFQLHSALEKHAEKTAR